MNTPSDRLRGREPAARRLARLLARLLARPLAARALGAFAAVAALGSCIQGPWDYYPKNPPIFRGIWLSGYAMANKPIQQVCMEKLLQLTEEHTDAFAFFDSAEVTVNGRFGDSTGTLRLVQRPDAPNCFAGDTAVKVAAGHDYLLRARVVWDSAGTQVVSNLTATAQVPDSFSIRPRAVAPSFAFTGGLPPNIFSVEFIDALPPEVKADTILQRQFFEYLGLVQSDTAAAAAYLKKNGKAFEERLTGLLRKYQSPYDEGDTLFYLGGILNTFSHYYTSDRSDDVAGVLITHRFDTLSERPETAFEGIFGTEPDSSEYYYEGSVRRLGMYPAARSPDGYNLLDSIGVVNTWFHTRLNRLYFYGMEDAYVEYVQTAIEGEGDPRIQVEYNVTGGRGFFVGGVPDSFDVNIKVDSFTKAFSLPEVHAYECNEDGWDSQKECIDYYRPYCQAKGWAPMTCRADALRGNLEAQWKQDSVLKAATDSAAAAATAAGDTAVLNFGVHRFCVENDFPSLGETCDADRRDCSQPGLNSCKDHLWTFCKENLWRPAQCGPALVWYCRDKPRLSEVMCRQADQYCREHPGEPACTR